MNCSWFSGSKALLIFVCLFTLVNATAQKISEAQLEHLSNSVKAGKDPYFIESNDTFSTLGPDCIIRDLLQDRNGNIWLASWKGIIKYDGKTFTNYTLKDGLIRFHIISCYADKKGNLWFSTARGGVYRYDGRSFRLFTMDHGLADNSVSSFAEDPKGNLWLATDKGASRYDGKTFTNFTTENGFPSNRVTCILAGSKGKIWFGCGASAYGANDGGLLTYDGKSFTKFIPEVRKPFTNVASLFEDRNGTIWIGRMDGLSLYDGESVTDLADNLSYYMTEDMKGKVWITLTEPPGGFHPGTPNQKLCFYDGEKFTTVLEKYKQGDCQVFGKIADREGNIWLGTMKGLCRYDGETFHYFTD
jgi:ligand-binding sensor domain-containing protein